MMDDLMLSLPGHDTTAALQAAGQVADAFASRSLFADYRSRKAPATRSAHDDDLATFVCYLSDAGIASGDLATDSAAWQGITWGLVSGFVQWQLERGAAISSINRRLSTIKVYTKLAARAGALPWQIYHMVRSVHGYTRQEGRRLNAERAIVRTGAKKAEPTGLTREQIQTLKRQPDTPQGLRDALLLCLLLDHGLRVGELALLRIEHLSLNAGTLTFDRPKVNKSQTHRLTADTLRAATAYLRALEATSGPLLRGSRKGGRLYGQMGVRSMRERVKVLGHTIGIESLSPHDCRHAWATIAVLSGTDVKALQDAGGWNSPAMPLRYVESAVIANDRVRLDV